jgi:hypothetical protein
LFVIGYEQAKACSTEDYTSDVMKPLLFCVLTCTLSAAGPLRVH